MPASKKVVLLDCLFIMDPMKPMEQMKQTQRTSTYTEAFWTWKDILWMALFAIGSLIIGVLALLILRAPDLDLASIGLDWTPDLLDSLALISIQVLALIGSVYFLGLRRRGLGWDAVGLRHTAWYWLLAAAAVSLFFLPIRGLIGLLVQSAMNIPAESMDDVLTLLAPADRTWWGTLAMIFLVGLAVPFAEEVFFRGVIYRWLRDRWGLWAGVIISSMVFGLVHGNVAMAASNFILGIILALMYEYSGSLWPAVAVHSVNNLVAQLSIYLILALQNLAGG